MVASALRSRRSPSKQAAARHHPAVECCYLQLRYEAAMLSKTAMVMVFKKGQRAVFFPLSARHSSHRSPCSHSLSPALSTSCVWFCQSSPSTKTAHGSSTRRDFHPVRTLSALAAPMSNTGTSAETQIRRPRLLKFKSVTGTQSIP